MVFFSVVFLSKAISNYHSFCSIYPIDWFLDVVMSTVQLAFSAPKMTNTLFLFYEIFVYFVYVFHWSPFIILMVFLLVPKPIKYGNSFFFNEEVFLFSKIM